MTVLIRSKYYRIHGPDGFIRHRVNFYNLLKIIGKHFHGSNKKSFNKGIKLLKTRLANTGYPTSSSEIHNLINSRIKYTYIEAVPEFRYQVYRVSKKIDIILKEHFSILNEIDKTGKYPIRDICRGPLGLHRN